jgi:micrococcal nuclease
MTRHAASLVLTLTLITSSRAGDVRQPTPPPTLEHALVVRVVDGDTIDVEVDGRRQRVRLIGIDTPELHESGKLERLARGSSERRSSIQALGRVADAYTRRALLEHGVGLSYDVEHFDRWHRVLAYIWLDDGTLFNAQLLRDGMATLLTIPPDVAYAAYLGACERAARDAQRGFWKTPAAFSEPGAPRRALQADR